MTNTTPYHSIDATEVTIADYEDFFAVDFEPVFVEEFLLPDECMWKSDFEPLGWPHDEQDASLPVTGVDWCDANAYCVWAGKHLCGSVNGGESPFSSYADLSSEWYRACGGNQEFVYPYGSVFEPDACNGVLAGFGALIESGSLQSCVTEGLAIYDLSGNSWEWTNSCDSVGMDSSLDPCRRRGGSYISAQIDLRCDVDESEARNYRSNNTGFRCCDGGMPWSEDFERGEPMWPEWVDGGQSSWQIGSTDPYAGVFAARAGTILEDQQSDLEITLIFENNGSISFWHRENTSHNQLTSGHNRLRFFIDDVQQGSWSGINQPWTMVNFNVAAGEHTFRWSYLKTYPYDADIWIDDIQTVGGRLTLVI